MTKLHAPSFQLMADKWPSPFVARQEVERFTGGIVNPKYIEWLESRSVRVGDDE